MDKVPAKPGDFSKSPHYAAHVGLLRMHSIFIEIGVLLRSVGGFASCSVSGRKGEEGEVDRDAVVMGTEEKSFQVAQEALVRLARSTFDEFGILHPDAGPDEAHTVGGHLLKILLPHRSIARAGEIPAILFGGEVIGAYRKERLASAGEK